MEFEGSYLGFSFNNVHSSSFGVVRTSSERYKEDLTSTFSDNKVVIPGADGTYYMGSNLGERKITIEFAFEKISPTQLNNLKSLCNLKGNHPLIFDEIPYKVYSARITDSVVLRYIPFETIY